MGERRLQDEGSSSLGVGAVLAIIAGVLVLVCAMLFLLRRASRWWKHRLRSAKVLDEIEMEFVNDDDGEFLRSTDTTNLNRGGGLGSEWDADANEKQLTASSSDRRNPTGLYCVSAGFTHLHWHACPSVSRRRKITQTGTLPLRAQHQQEHTHQAIAFPTCLWGSARLRHGRD
eukprot:CAMPEP_0183350674 /NCGR_PEP_ID=MMETSP0164_2-20130417/20713_1 /TAXON_ID=221442 /ORGANISM="Coccolithus pelagicus ssp braarudi, Strain PLY182g" /LENGTH=172 /DNA_ID=CAMNT_0025522649 /DNA_START=194 /DNA_END=713 /DNA_ORIENTATION=+